MSTRRPSLPPEAVDLYTRYVHGEITRRHFLHGLKYSKAAADEAWHRTIGWFNIYVRG